MICKFEHKKVGHFKKLARDQFFNRKGTENEIPRFRGISKKLGKCYHVKNTSLLFGASHGTPRMTLKLQYILKRYFEYESVLAFEIRGF